MKILALDAATEACSVALQIDDSIIHRFEVCPQQHSQKLLPFVDEVLGDAGITLNQLDAIAFGQGPGSFTGVRIGVSITQGLAFGADLPVIGVSNLAAMAQQAIAEHQAERVVAAIDARMSEVYLGIYDNASGMAKLIGTECVAKPQEIVWPTGLQDKHLWAVGTGWQTYGELLVEQISANSTGVNLPSAEHMLPIAIAEFQAGNARPAELAQPNYVRDEVTWQKLPGR